MPTASLLQGLEQDLAAPAAIPSISSAGYAAKLLIAGGVPVSWSS